MSDARPARIRLGMVGGGKDAFIGAVHRIAARIDDHYELVAGALSVDAGEGARVGPRRSGCAQDRTYDDFADDGQARGAAEGRHRGGGDRHAEPHARARGARVPASAASTSSATSR